MSCRFTRHDIDSLIEVVQELKAVQASETVPQQQARLEGMIQHTRKVYMMLLHAADNSELTLRDLFSSGFSAETPIHKAVESLCPLTLSFDHR